MAARRGLENSPNTSASDGQRTQPIAGQHQPLTTGRIGQLVRFHLREQTPKQVARRIAETSGADLSTETVRNWKREEGRNAPDVASFLLLCRAYPALAAEARRLIEMEAALDPNFQRALAAFVTAWQRGRR